VTGILLRWLRGGRIPIVGLLALYLVSLGQVAFRDRAAPGEDIDPNEVVITISHWQLESGLREAFDWAAKEYRKVKPHVRLKQLPVGGKIAAYDQWLSTQLLGGTAPDIIEMPYAAGTPIFRTICARHFLPLSDIITVNNPYNKGTDLEHVSLRETFLDNLRLSYVPELQEYYGLSMTYMLYRFFYNVRLLKELTGLDNPPAKLHLFLDVCKTIKSRRDSFGRQYIPIAGSKQAYGIIPHWATVPISHNILYLIEDGVMDGVSDGKVGSDELFEAWVRGRITFREDPFRLGYEASRLLFNNFQDGWIAMERDHSLFMFLQQRAVFIPTGPWEYPSLKAQADFPFAVCELTAPTPDDPVFGHAVAGPPYDRSWASGDFAINRDSKHLEEAKDFILWFFSQKTNEQFCGQIGWIPSIRGAKLSESAKAFQPRFNGVQGPVQWAIGQQTQVAFTQQYDLFMLGKTDYDSMIDVYEKDLVERGILDFQETSEDLRRTLLSREALILQMRGRLLSGRQHTGLGDPIVRYAEFLGNRAAGVPEGLLRKSHMRSEWKEVLASRKAANP
jgi:ABC-type glycerol-3-phosphate transport system substrate-binding protein